jgi:hypothetical protein
VTNDDKYRTVSAQVSSRAPGPCRGRARPSVKRCSSHTFGGNNGTGGPQFAPRLIPRLAPSGSCWLGWRSGSRLCTAGPLRRDPCGSRGAVGVLQPGHLRLPRGSSIHATSLRHAEETSIRQRAPIKTVDDNGRAAAWTGCRRSLVGVLPGAQRYSGFSKSNRQPASHSDRWLPYTGILPASADVADTDGIVAAVAAIPIDASKREVLVMICSRRNAHAANSLEVAWDSGPVAMIVSLRPGLIRALLH